MDFVPESPQIVRTSFAGAICLGLEKGKFAHGAECTCLNLLLTYKNGCQAACSYCGLARNRNTDQSETFIRVKWPTFPLDDILNRVQTGRHPFRRVCVSMITQGQSVADISTVVQQCRRKTNLPVSSLLCPTVMRGKPDLEAIKAAGADRIGIAVDAATRELFEMHRGQGVRGPHNWDQFWKTLEEAVEVFGRYKVGVHLIVGLGETEAEMVQIISMAYQLGIKTHLFSLFPETGSLLEKNPQPPLGTYRRIQLARYLIDEEIISLESFRFSPEGQIVDYGVEIEKYLSEGKAFMTSGCPGEDGQTACNRPFANERPSGPIRNYPFIPKSDDMEIIRGQIWSKI
jgi:lipoyl synthase